MTECQANLLVCLKADATRLGYTTGKSRPLGSSQAWQIRFSDGHTEYKPLRSLNILETAPSDESDEFETLKAMAFTPLGRMRLGLTHHRLSGRLANLIYSLDATNTDFYPHQYKPVLAMINSPTKGILIGDEVGLGKTIEAGLIWTELRSRFQYSRILIVCKAFLKPKWGNEFKEKFGIALEETNPTDLFERLDKNKPRDGFALVASYDSLRPPKGWRGEDSPEGDTKRNQSSARLARFLDDHEGEDLIDLVVFDECQYMRNDMTSNHQIGRLLTKTSAHAALLSATPINNSTDDLYNLFNLLDESLFPYQSEFPRLIKENAPLVRLRDDLIRGMIVTQDKVKEALEDVMSRSLFETNEQLTFLLQRLPNDKDLKSSTVRARLAFDLEKVNLLGKIFTRTRKRDIDGKRPKREAASLGVDMSDTERMVYSVVTQAIQDYADENDMTTGFLFNMPQQQMCSSFAAAVYWWRHQKEVDITGDLSELAGGGLSKELGYSDDRRSRPLFDAISHAVESLGDLSDLEVNDTKFKVLLQALVRYREENPHKKILLFSFFKQTLRYLKRRLEKEGFGVELLYGGMDKEAALDAFKSSAKIDILLASEVAAEGVDLQFSSLVINYDLPWNPMRVEQRIGRIDRLGQAASVIQIWNLFYNDSIDDRVYMKLYGKLEIFTNALGGMEDIIGERIDELTARYLRHGLSEAELTAQIVEIEMAIENMRVLERELDDKSMQLVAHGDFIKQAINEAREFGRFVRVDDLIAYVDEFFKRRYSPSTLHCIDLSKQLFKIDLSASAMSDIADYWHQNRIFSPTKLANPALIGKTVFKFSNRVGQSAPGTELITQFHPITRFIASKIDLEQKARPSKTIVAGAVETRGKFPIGHYLFGCQRFGFTSGKQAIERLVFQAMSLSDGRLIDVDRSELLVNLSLTSGKPYADHNDLDGEQLVNGYGELLQSIHDLFEAERSRLQRETNDRVTVQLTALENYKATETAKHNAWVDAALAEKKISVAKAQETRLKNLLAKLDVKREGIEKSKNLGGSPDFVSAGLITVLN